MSFREHDNCLRDCPGNGSLLRALAILISDNKTNADQITANMVRVVLLNAGIIPARFLVFDGNPIVVKWIAAESSRGIARIAASLSVAGIKAEIRDGVAWVKVDQQKESS